VRRAGVRRVVIEIGVSAPWSGVGDGGGLVIGHDDFGTSAPDKALQHEFGFTPEAVVARSRRHLF
jgi:transketolase